ncbi:MAG: TetR/AcrR family transcriptional regulator [Draconibacterium sp.]
MKEFVEQYFEPIKNMFFSIGIKNVTMDSICTELGISKRTLYQKFNHKSQLVEEIVHKDIYNFIEKIKSAKNKSPNAIYETCLLFEIVKEKQDEICSSTLYDLKKYYYSLNEEIIIRINQTMIETITGIIERGIEEGICRKNIESFRTAGLLSFIFHSFIMKSFVKPTNRILTLNNLLDYHLHSICNQKGKTEWEKIKIQ